MLESFQRLWRGKAAQTPDTRLFAVWAQRRGDTVKHVRDGSGVVAQYAFNGRAARMEWGPSQRDYMGPRELRVRIELGLPAVLEMMVISRWLAEQLENQAYQRLVEGQQTQVDVNMPEEARWLAMFERVAIDPAYAPLVASYAVLGSSPGYTRRWVEGELATRLARALSHWLAADAPLVLMVARGHLLLRTAAPSIDETVLEGVRLLAESAAARALRSVAKSSDTPATEFAGLPPTQLGPLEATPGAEGESGFQPSALDSSLTPIPDAGPPTDIEV